MPSLRVRWKGRPHNHLPRVQPISPRRASFASQSTVRSATEEVLRSPLPPALRNERRKQRQIVRNRRSGGSRGSVANSSRRRIYARPVRNVHFTASQNSQMYSGTREQYQKSAAIVSTDGAGMLKPSPAASSQSTGTVLDFGDSDKPHTFKPEHQYSDLGYSSTYAPDERPTTLLDYKKRPRRRSTSMVVNEWYPETHTEHAPTESLVYVDRSNSPFKRPKTVDLDRSYDHRIAPHKQPDCLPSETSSSIETAQHIHESITSPTHTKRPLKARYDDDALWETIDSTRFPPNDTPSEAPSLISKGPSRTRSQDKKLTRFKKELELHYKAVSSLPKQSLKLSPSATTISANTVKDFLPFHDQFKSAGLAVTSSEQQANSPPRHNANSPCVSRISDRRRQHVGGHDGPGSYASGTTGTTVLGFTPPHEKSYGVSTKDRTVSSSGSDYTAVGFTPPHEKMMARWPPQPSRPAPLSPARSSIPWLQRQDVSPKQTFIPPRLNTVSTVQPNQFENSRVLGSRTSYQTSRNVVAPRRSTIFQRTAPGYLNDGLEKPLPDQPRNVDNSTQTKPLINNYVDAVTQTNHEVADPHLPDVSRSHSSLNVSTNAIKSTRDSHNVSTYTIKSTRDPSDEGRSVACGGKGSSWKRSRLPWELPEEIVTQCPMAPGDHGINGVCFEVHEVGDQRSESPTISDEGSCQTAIQMSFSTPCPPDLLPPRCPDCIVILNSANENLDGPAQSHSNAEEDHVHGNMERSHALCESCSRSVYTAYVIPPNRDSPLVLPELKASHHHAKKQHHRHAERVLVDGEEETERLVEAFHESSGRKHKYKHAKNRDTRQPEPVLVDAEEAPEKMVEAFHESSGRKHKHNHAKKRDYKQPESVPGETEDAPEKMVEVFHESSGTKAGHKTMDRSNGFSHHLRVRDPVKRPSEPRIDPDYTLSTRGIDPEEIKLQSIHRTSHHRHRPHSQRYNLWNQTGHLTANYHVAGPQVARARHLTTSSTRHKHQFIQHHSNTMPHAPISTSTLSTSAPQKGSKTTNKKIFDGLQVATAAACDRDLDAWLTEVNGTGVRHFLANLSKFEPLGVNALSSVAKRAARDRREQLRHWEKMRGERMKKLEEQKMEGHGDHGEHADHGLDKQTDGVKDVDEGTWTVGDDGVKKRGNGGYSLGKEGIVRDE